MPEVDNRNTFGHWEADTVVGKKKKGEPVVFTKVERLTGNYFAFKIGSKTTEGVKHAMEQLHAEFGEQFSKVFKTITTDNGAEFASFSEFEKYMTKIYFAHPYSSWERPVNERTNGMLMATVTLNVFVIVFYICSLIKSKNNKRQLDAVAC